MFAPDTKPNSREEMIEYLSGHLKRNHGMGGDARGFANNMKVHHLELPKRLSDKAYQMLDFDELSSDVGFLMDEFNTEHNGWIVHSAGRSGGYYVLTNRSQPNYYRDFDEDSIEALDTIDLVAMVDVLYDFDKLCDNARDCLIQWCENYDVVEETVMVPKKVLRLVEIGT